MNEQLLCARSVYAAARAGRSGQPTIAFTAAVVRAPHPLHRNLAAQAHARAHTTSQQPPAWCTPRLRASVYVQWEVVAGTLPHTRSGARSFARVRGQIPAAARRGVSVPPMSPSAPRPRELPAPRRGGAPCAAVWCQSARGRARCVCACARPPTAAADARLLLLVSCCYEKKVWVCVYDVWSHARARANAGVCACSVAGGLATGR